MLMSLPSLQTYVLEDMVEDARIACLYDYNNAETLDHDIACCVYQDHSFRTLSRDKTTWEIIIK